MIMTRPVEASKLIFGLLASIMWLGCSENASYDVLDESEDPVYRRAKDLLARNLNAEALANFDKLIMMRAGRAPESHLEAGLIYLDHMDDPVSAYYHFNRFKRIKDSEPKSPSNEASLARVEDLIKTAKKELLSTLDAREYRNKLLDTIESLHAENETLRKQLSDSRKGAFNQPNGQLALEPDPAPSLDRSQPQRPSSTASEPQERRVYVVKARDSLYKISREVYGDGSRWKEILQANRAVLPSENHLQPGMSLIIP